MLPDLESRQKDYKQELSPAWVCGCPYMETTVQRRLTTLVIKDISMDFPWRLAFSNSLFLKVLSTWAPLGVKASFLF